MSNQLGTTSINELPITNSVGIINNIKHNQQDKIMNIESEQLNQTNQINKINQQPNLVDDNIKNIVNESQQHSYNELISQIQQADKSGATQLPSRDIPQNTDNIIMDQQTKPNFIPESDELKDYISNYETPNDVIEENNKEAENLDTLERLYREMQTPLLLAILYFLFNLPVIRKYLYKFIPNLFSADGNPNLFGYVFNSITFALLYYVLNHLIINIVNL